ncbi:DeoR family transcriptional regulator [Halolactibacillus alkaliphilus]|uniref:DeoR family transcriptional regulator n=1 Tax=Halolactibacillus alkaliphilus TaxID=442899 RepID=A0A511X1P3_9BACI|nr:DeoR/GlpR family DNA-binding transcription regulator [Halolactibacillus alkaliphilus]GEN56841.1 DeoR family transcriptional regulator [Halolactibacillus alkaliphilus]GGN71499.1 DeoR family transcriptional regulator [Halolactibacillus alkaliphilus]SFO82000.1 transcriptional regulator, DeoR family [Halolactibacillus alkaliphilus]
MLTPKRHALIIEELNKKDSVTIQDLVDLMGVSESTIRRDLSELENQEKLTRVHGGATTLHHTKEEPSYEEKKTRGTTEKKQIAQYASTLVEDHDVIYLDAGTTTYEMIPFLKDRPITVVTNGLMHLDLLQHYRIPTYIIGGKVKDKTGAIIGSVALKQLEHYHFNIAFIGANGIDLAFGYSTPDPEEGDLKERALRLSDARYVLADETKLNHKSAYRFADLKEATLITNHITPADKKRYTKITDVEEAKR